MKQEEKSLLLKDLCARLPYEVKVAFQVGNNIPDIRIFTGKDYDYLKFYHYIDEFTNCTFKPYLRTMSSMTEKERHYIRYHFCPEYYFDVDLQGNISDNDGSYIYEIELSKIVGYIDYLNAHHFDYHHLIEKGLALKAPEGMY